MFRGEILLKLITRHEIKLLFADRTFFVLLILLTTFIAYGIFNGTKSRDNLAASTAEVGGELNAKLDKNQKDLTEFEASKTSEKAELPPASDIFNIRGRVAARPSQLALISVGQSDLQPLVTNQLRAFLNKYDLFINFEQSNPINLLAGRFDLAFVVIFLFPLLIFALSYNLLSQEREAGILQILMSQPVSLKQIILGKVIARFGLILLIALIITMAGIALGGVNFSGDTAIRLVLLAAAVFLYCLFWFLLAVFINTKGLPSAANAAFLIGCWLSLTVILPTLLNIIITSIYPVPSRLEYLQNVRQIELEAESVRGKLIDKFYLDNPQMPLPDKAKGAFYGDFFIAKEEREKRIMPEAERYDQQIAKQQQTVNRLHFLSPAIAMQETLNEIAGTGRNRHNNFVVQVREYFRQWNEIFRPIVFNQTKLTSADYAKIPRFVFQEESTLSIVSRVFFILLNLLIPSLLIGFFTFRSLAKFKIAG